MNVAPSWPVRVALTCVLAYVVLTAAGLLLLAQAPSAALAVNDTSVPQEASFAFSSLAFVIVGFVVVSRLPAHPLGWLFLSIGMLETVFRVAFGYVYAGLGEQLPGLSLAAWLTAWTSPLSGVLVAFSLLLFPDGHLLSRRWRALAWGAVVTGAVVVVDAAFSPGTLPDLPTEIDNPVGSSALGLVRNIDLDVLIAPMVIVGIGSLVVRFRRAGRAQRQQLKMLVYAVSMLLALLALGLGVEAMGLTDNANDVWVGYVFAAVLAGIPIATGISILRYRLFDVDVVINRTLVYAVLTATLAAAYFGLVLLLQFALSPVTQRSDLAVAGSTLAVAALFRPARSRIQDWVDRRFYRSRYDASRTMHEFNAGLREQVDLDALGEELRSVVRATMQPAHVSLWLRQS